MSVKIHIVLVAFGLSLASSNTVSFEASLGELGDYLHQPMTGPQDSFPPSHWHGHGNHWINEEGTRWEFTGHPNQTTPEPKPHPEPEPCNNTKEEIRIKIYTRNINMHRAAAIAVAHASDKTVAPDIWRGVSREQMRKSVHRYLIGEAQLSISQIGEGLFLVETLKTETNGLI